jgi:hypothetical protein
VTCALWRVHCAWYSYADFDVWGDAAAECRQARSVMRGAPEASGSQEVWVGAQQLGGPAMGQQLPVLHGLGQSLTNFVLGLRDALSTSELRVALTSYTDTKIAALAPAQHAGKARFDRDGPPAAGGVEKRVDPSDGCSYSRQEVPLALNLALILTPTLTRRTGARTRGRWSRMT